VGASPGSARLKLLLDEMYPPAIAEQLLRRGHDAHAVAARAELRTLPDAEIFAVAQHEQRIVVTENIDDFSAIADSHDRRGQTHHGLILVTPRRYPRGNPRTIGQMVTALAKLLDEQPGTTPTSLRHWL
jgi:predicted nuclease of predicted toxin-antitoxin system